MQKCGSLLTKMGIRNKKILDKIITRGSPTSVSANTATLMVALEQGNFYVCVAGGNYYQASSLGDALLEMVKGHWAFHVNYSRNVLKVFEFIEVLCGVKNASQLSRSQRAMLL